MKVLTSNVDGTEMIGFTRGKTTLHVKNYVTQSLWKEKIPYIKMLIRDVSIVMLTPRLQKSP